MATLFGHAMGALTVYSAMKYLAPSLMLPNNRGIMAALATGILPDLDVGLLLIFPTLFKHRGFTHSTVFAVCAAFIVAFVFPWQGWEALVKRTLFFIPIALAHPVLDYLMGCGPPVPFAWPLSSKGWLCPVQLIPTAYYSRSVQGLIRLLLSPRNFLNYVLEVVSLAPIMYGFWQAAHPSRKGSWLGIGILGLVSACGFYVTYYLYNTERGAAVVTAWNNCFS